MVEAANSSCDDANYDYIIREDEILADRYQVKNRIGKVIFYRITIKDVSIYVFYRAPLVK